MSRPPVSVALALTLLPLGSPSAAEPKADAKNAFVRDHNFDMVALDLSGEVDIEGRALTATARWTVARLAPGELRLDAIAFSGVAATVDGKPVAVRTLPDELWVAVPDSPRGSTSVVEVHYSAHPQVGLHWRGVAPDTYLEVYSQGELEDNRHWFPSYDHPDDRFAYSGAFTVKGHPDWTALTNPTPDLPSYLVMLAAAPYVVVKGPADAVPTRALLPPKTPESWAHPALDPLPDMMSHFASRTGVPYAWGDYDQTFVQRFIFGGMENTGSTIMNQRMLAPPELVATRSWIPSVVAHELAHQWYGDLLTTRTARDMWLNEGFATFFAADWQVHDRTAKEGEAAGAALFAAQVDGWRRASLDSGSLAGRWALGSPEPSHNVYNKGAMVLSTLRWYLGEETFWAAIRTYTTGHAHGSVDTLDLERVMETTSGRDLAWLFQQWTELPGAPKVHSSWHWEADKVDKAGIARGTLTVELHQEPGPGGATAPLTLPVDIAAADGAPVRAWMTSPDLTVTLPLAAAPAFVAIDPGGGLLVDWAQEQPPEAWAAALVAGTPYTRQLAAHALAELGAPVAPAPDALAERFADLQTPEVLRETLADALGTRRTGAPLLAAALTDADPRVRLAAAGALGRCPDRTVVPTLLARIPAEPNRDVRAALLRAASGLDPDRALPQARKTLVDKSVIEGEQTAALAVISLVGVPADLDVLLRPGTPRDVRLGGLRAATAIVSRQALGPARDALRARVARSADALLQDLDLRGVQGALSVLHDTGDSQSVALLEAFRRQTTVPDLAASATATIKAIAARVDTVAPATPNEIDARLDAAEKRLDELEAGMKVEKF